MSYLLLSLSKWLQEQGIAFFFLFFFLEGWRHQGSCKMTKIEHISKCLVLKTSKQTKNPLGTGKKIKLSRAYNYPCPL